MAHLATRVDGGADDWQLDARAKDSFSDSSNVTYMGKWNTGKNCVARGTKNTNNRCNVIKSAARGYAYKSKTGSGHMRDKPLSKNAKAALMQRYGTTTFKKKK